MNKTDKNTTYQGGGEIDTYTVWVGGTPDVEGVSKSKADEVANEWKGKGYDDVIIEKDNDGSTYQGGER